MKNIFIIIKKELLRVFKDPKLIFVVILLPGLLIFALYTFMGDALSNVDSSGTDPLIICYVDKMPESFKNILEDDSLEINATYTKISASELDASKEKLKTNEVNVILAFDEDFENLIENIDSSKAKPNITVYYNSTETKSAEGYQKVAAAISIYKANVEFKEFGDTLLFTQSVESIYNEKTASGKLFAMLVPFLIISLLFSGCMSVAPDSIAGEKERGTISTLLIKPVKRREIAIGKIVALSILAVLNAISSFIGLMLSMPKLMGMTNATGIYGAGEYVLILLIIISTVLIIISAMSVISCFARTVKEATMLITPFMLLSMVVGITSMISSAASVNWFIYLIPLYNSVQSLIAVLTFNVNFINLAITIVSNVVYMGILVFVLSKLFNKERIMFAK